MPTNLGTVYAKVTLDTSGLVKGKTEATGIFKSIERDAVRLSERMATIGKTMSLAITAPLLAMGAASVQTATRMDSLRRSLNSITGSAEETDRQLRRLREAAKLPGLGFQQLIEGSVRLQAAGLAAHEAEAALKAFGNAIAIAGGTKEDLREVGNQLGQIAAAGKLQGDELRVIAERVPQVRAAIREAFGTASTEEINKFGLTANEIINRIVTEMQKLPGATQSAQSQFDNFSDTLNDLKAQVGAAFLPAITAGLEKISKGIESATNWFRNLDASGQSAFATIAGTLAATGPVMLALSGFLAMLDKIGKSVVFRFLFSPPGAAIVAGTAATAWAANETNSITGMANQARAGLERDRERRGIFNRAGGGMPGLRALFGGQSPREAILSEQARRAQAGNVFDPLTGRIRPRIAPATDAWWKQTLKATKPPKAGPSGPSATDLEIQRMQWEAQLTDDPLRRAELERQINLLQKMPGGFADRFFAQSAGQVENERWRRGFQSQTVPNLGTAAEQREFISRQRRGMFGFGGSPFDLSGLGGMAQSFMARRAGARGSELFGGIMAAGQSGVRQSQAAAFQTHMQLRGLAGMGSSMAQGVTEGVQSAIASAMKMAADNLKRSEEVRKRFRDAFSFLGDLGAEVGAEFYYGMRDSLQRLFGGGTIGRILSNSISRSLSRTFDTLIDTAITGLSKNAMRGAGGKGITGGEHRFTWQSLGGLALGAAASAGIGAVIGGLFKGAGIGKLLGGLFKAGGGGVSAGRGYIVGERGPELFVPKTGGMIVPNHALAGAGGITINMGGAYHIREEADIGRLAREVAIRVERGSRARPGT